MNFRRFGSWLAVLCMTEICEAADRPGVNHDENKVVSYTLPDPLVFEDGKPVKTADDWQRRRAEILGLFETDVYGKTPIDRPAGMIFETLDVDDNAIGGKAIRKQIAIYFTGKKDGSKAEVLLYLPKKSPKPSPVFIGLNFNGNQAVQADPGIRMTSSWMREAKDGSVVDHRATEKSRGIESRRWPIEKIVDRGYAVATAYYGDIDPDFHDGYKNGVHPIGDEPGKDRNPDTWGSIGAWAWGLSRIADMLETEPAVDAKRIAVLGHSRLGKTSLWAGAQDNRFGIVITNNSGCGGAALSRRNFGETVAIINMAFPHWFCDNFKKYNDKESELPVDQHELVALMAPRPVYIASAEEDLWADPKGEFLAGLHADPVYKLLGTEGLGSSAMPSLSQPIFGTIGYHIRPGKHDVTDYDWQCFMDFADKHWGKPQ